MAVTPEAAAKLRRLLAEQPCASHDGGKETKTVPLVILADITGLTEQEAADVLIADGWEFVPDGDAPIIFEGGADETEVE